MPESNRESLPALAADAFCKPLSAAPIARSAATVATSLAASTRLKATTTPPKARRYVDLGDAAPVKSAWLNDPSYMKLETYSAEDQKVMLKS